jgi:hypothetical protein
MKRKTIQLAGLAIVLLCVAALLFVRQRQADLRAAKAQREGALARAQALASPVGTPVVSNGTSAGSSAEANIGPLVRQPQSVVEQADLQMTVKTQKVAQAKKQKTKKVLQDPLARDALAMVGIDPAAEIYWFEAIHNPNLPASERQDLIDDLNEEGLPDPKHPALEDLPLLIVRIEILYQLIPTLTPDFDWREPLDDLLNLADVAMGGGREVK